MNIVLHFENGNNLKIDNVINRNVSNKEYLIISKQKDEENKTEEFRFLTEDIKFVTFA